jgi:Fe-Mn family superoxide dismutase
MFKLPDLPYPSEALEPVLSGVQMRTHHDKHHATYVNNINNMLGQTGDQPGSLEDLVRQAYESKNQKLFNNAAQAWNHGFFWECMAPQKSEPSGQLAQAIQTSFGGLDQLKTRFVEEGATHFASGWAWLVANGQELQVYSTHDADSALIRGGAPVLVCDVWEHAYYLDYKQDRKGFLEKWFDQIANWSFAEQQFASANGGGQGYRYPPPS